MSRTVARDWSRLSAQVVPGVDHLHARFAARAYERHAHDDALVVGLIEQGVQRSAYGRTSYVACAGAVVLIDRGVAHDGSPGDETGFVYRSLHIDHRLACDLLADVAGDARRERGGAAFAAVEPVLTRRDVAAAVRGFCAHATDSAAGPADREAALLAMFRAFARLVRGGVADAATARREPGLVGTARAYIHAHLHEPGLSVSRVAACCGATRSHLTRAFRDATGLPPHAYLNLQRVQAARALIARGEPVAGVASAAGFADQSHLIRRFKGVYGVTPRQFFDAAT